MRQEKAQSILEYTLLLGAVIAVVVLVLIGGKSNVKTKVQNTYEKFGTALENTTNDLTGGVFK
jgi:Flp pilus assembly pilin Flp